MNTPAHHPPVGETRGRGAHAAPRTRGQQYWPWLAGVGAAVVLTVAVLLSAVLAGGPRALVPAVLLAVAFLALGALTVTLGLLGGARRSLRSSEELCGELFATLAAARGQSVHDDETDLLNRAGLDLIGTQVLEAARRSGGAVHACVVEIGAGTPADPTVPVPTPEQRRADRVATAEVLRRATRSSDVLARDGGDHYLVLGPGSGLHAQELERRVRVGLAQHRLSQRSTTAVEGGVRQLRPTVEVGTSMLAPWDEGGVAELVAGAELALQRRRALRAEPGAGTSAAGRRRGDAAEESGPLPGTGRPEAGGRAGA
ncbi:GGDEF domain-containing protein [Kineococcus gynurae]|uniref:GGDEF domain-containing protein n=1 Tax=Kineococcus gynurae TaxID=452979 RepID=A0ABV5LVW3_9ACTN